MPGQRTMVLAASNAPGTQYFQQPTLHQEYLSALQEAQWKVDEHREALKTYRHWAAVVPKGPAEYELTFDDAVFFGL